MSKKDERKQNDQGRHDEQSDVLSEYCLYAGDLYATDDWVNRYEMIDIADTYPKI
jgi:hypothetical protein